MEYKPSIDNMNRLSILLLDCNTEFTQLHVKYLIYIRNIFCIEKILRQKFAYILLIIFLLKS